MASEQVQFVLFMGRKTSMKPTIGLDFTIPVERQLEAVSIKSTACLVLMAEER